MPKDWANYLDINYQNTAWVTMLLIWMRTKNLRMALSCAFQRKNLGFLGSVFGST